MFTFERQHKILQLLGKNPSVRISELSTSLGVSEATVRRDLDRLCEIGTVKRIHGGAVLVERTPPEAPVIQRATVNIAEKRRIGTLTAGLVKAGDTVFIGSGTTALEVARALSGRQDLTVITNSQTVINLLSQEDGIMLIGTGGFLRSTELSFIGHLTEQALRELRPQKVIMGIRAISLEHGLSNDYLPEVSTDRVIIQSAPEVVLVADHSKFGKVATALVAPLSAIHTLVTDNNLDSDTVAALRGMGKNVYLA